MNIGIKWKKTIELIIISLFEKLKLSETDSLFKIGVFPANKKLISKIKI
tara:strand:+ start:256 stop:402 length:147 start_codon:yes stop_codon:yes gene_type:complete